jgi:hypothetical protein
MPSMDSFGLERQMWTSIQALMLRKRIGVTG